MLKALPKDDLQRLDALEQYEAVGGAPDPTLAEITALAADICGTPMAGISLMAGDTIHFLARVGPGASRLPRRRMPDETCINGEGVHEISDARYHQDYRPDGIMIAGRAFRFYAGAPLTTPGGVTIGCLFVQDSVPHTLTELQKRALLTLSRQVINRFELMSRMRLMSRDSRVRLRVESELTVERNFVATVLDTVGALVAVFDTAGRIVRFNRACEEVSGYEFIELVGGYVWDKADPALGRSGGDCYLRAAALRGVSRELRELLAQPRRQPATHCVVGDGAGG